MAVDFQIKEAFKEVTTEFRSHLIDDVQKELKAFDGRLTGETQQKLERMNSRIDELEIIIQKAAIPQQQIARPERKTVYPYRPSRTYKDSYRGTPEDEQAVKAFLQTIKNGGTPEAFRELREEQKTAWHNVTQAAWRGKADGVEEKAISILDNTAGGYLLLPPDYVADIIRNLVLISPLRDYAKVRQTTRFEVQQPVRTATLSAQWISETGTRSDSATGLKYGLQRIQTYEMYALVLISHQQMDDAAFDMQSEITFDVTQQFAKTEGLAFVSGTASGQPEGILTNSSVSVVNSGNSSTLTYTGLVNLLHQGVQTFYANNGMWYMARSTIGAIRNMVDSNNRPIWVPTYGSLDAGNPATILDKEYVEVPDMPSVASNAYPVVFGDLKSAYMIVDRQQIEMQRLNEQFALSGQIGLLFKKRIGGQVMLAEAMAKQLIHT